MLRINKLIKDFDYNGEFLDSNDLSDLLSNHSFNDFNELIYYLEDSYGNYIGDDILSLADSKIDIYYYDLRQFSCENYSYIEDAISEFGLEEPDFHKIIQMGQYYAYNNEFYLMTNEFAEYIKDNYKF